MLGQPRLLLHYSHKSKQPYHFSQDTNLEFRALIDSKLQRIFGKAFTTFFHQTFAAIHIVVSEPRQFFAFSKTRSPSGSSGFAPKPEPHLSNKIRAPFFASHSAGAPAPVFGFKQNQTKSENKPSRRTVRRAYNLVGQILHHKYFYFLQVMK